MQRRTIEEGLYVSLLVTKMTLPRANIKEEEEKDLFGLYKRGGRSTFLWTFLLLLFFLLSLFYFASLMFRTWMMEFIFVVMCS
jgi:hypothetical protein